MNSRILCLNHNFLCPFFHNSIFSVALCNKVYENGKMRNSLTGELNSLDVKFYCFCCENFFFSLDELGALSHVLSEEACVLDADFTFSE